MGKSHAVYNLNRQYKYFDNSAASLSVRYLKHTVREQECIFHRRIPRTADWSLAYDRRALPPLSRPTRSWQLPRRHIIIFLVPKAPVSMF